MILVGDTGGRCTASVNANATPVSRDQIVAVAPDLDGRAVQQNPAVLGHYAVQPAAGRSNHRCICPVPTEFS